MYTSRPGPTREGVHLTLGYLREGAVSEEEAGDGAGGEGKEELAGQVAHRVVAHVQRLQQRQHRSIAPGWLRLQRPHDDSTTTVMDD